MEVIISGQENKIDSPVVIALGNFDGLHVAHMKLINKAVEIKTKMKCKVLVYIFSNHPSSFIPGKDKVLSLTDNDMKVELLTKTEVDYIYFETFNNDIMLLSPREFIDKILTKKFNVRAVIAGFDYRFGYKGEGDTDTLMKLGKEYEFAVSIIEPVKINNIIVSSTIIREMINSGDVQSAALFLNRYFSVKGRVVQGNGFGNKIGFPTANLIPKPGFVIPADGVYITETKIDGLVYDSITNIGYNPTVSGKNKTIETHIFDFSKNIYEKEMEIFFKKRIRGEKKFTNTKELHEQILKDIKYAKNFKNKAKLKDGLN